MDPEQWADIINACLERGFVLPLHVCAVSVNGAVLVVRYSESEEDEESIDGEVVVQHFPAAGAQLPINDQQLHECTQQRFTALVDVVHKLEEPQVEREFLLG